MTRLLKTTPRWTTVNANRVVLEARETASQRPPQAAQAKRQQALSIQGSISTLQPQESQYQINISTIFNGVP